MLLNVFLGKGSSISASSRKNIWGVCRFDEDRDLAFDQMVRSAASCVPTGMPLPHPPYHAPNPRPRLPTMIRTPRPPMYQQPLSLGELIYIHICSCFVIIHWLDK